MSDEGLRGAVAVRDMNKSQIAVHLPAHIAVELGEGHVTSEVKTTAPQHHRILQMFMSYFEVPVRSVGRTSETHDGHAPVNV